jgi:hypothetical protein
MIRLKVLPLAAPQAILAAALVFTSPLARAVILFPTGDPTYNTTEPGGALTGSGWQYEGSFGSFLGTAISPHHFVTVKHIGIQSNVFVYQGVSYPIVSWSDAPVSELRIFEVSGTLPSYASLYSRNNELGRHIVVVGRGTQRGDPVYLGGSLRGWLWGPGDGVQRWGENQISEASGNELWATFDQSAGPNEAQLSAGDSGGAVFLLDRGAWKLAGICFAADGPIWTTPTGGEISAALFDRRGFYDAADGSPISGAGPVPGRFVAVRISAELAWIRSIIPAPSPSPTAPTGNLAQMLSPAVGTILPSSTVAFNWSAGKASGYRVFIGNSLGAADIYNSGTVGAHSVIVNNIPTNGVTIYVRLFSKVKRKWKYIDYTYTAYG